MIKSLYTIRRISAGREQNRDGIIVVAAIAVFRVESAIGVGQDVESAVGVYPKVGD